MRSLPSEEVVTKLLDRLRIWEQKRIKQVAPPLGHSDRIEGATLLLSAKACGGSLGGRCRVYRLGGSQRPDGLVSADGYTRTH